MSRKSAKWKAFVPGDFYAWDLSWDHPVDEATVRRRVAAMCGTPRCSPGTFVEPGSTLDWYRALSPADRAEQDFIFSLG